MTKEFKVGDEVFITRAPKIDRPFISLGDQGKLLKQGEVFTMLWKIDFKDGRTYWVNVKNFDHISEAYENA